MRSIARYLMGLILPLLPETRCFGFKRWMLRRTGARVGRNVRICSSALFLGGGYLEIGDNTWIGHRCILSSSSSISIGSDCDFAPNVYVGTGTHELTVERKRVADVEVCRDVVIGSGCWLCVNATILPGVTLGDKCVVAAGAVVTGASGEDRVLLAGVPAVVKKSL